jgi:hypothetical protein
VPADDVGTVGKPARVAVVGGAQEQGRRVDGPAGQDDDVRRVVLAGSIPLDDDLAHLPAGGAGFQVFDEGVGRERDVGMRQRRVHAANLGVRLGVDQAGEAVAALAADAGALVRGLLVKHDAQRRVEGVQAEAGEFVGQVLDAQLVADRRVQVRGAGGRLGRVFAAGAVDVIQPLRLGVVGLEVVVADGPGRGQAAVVADLAEVLLAEAE